MRDKGRGAPCMYDFTELFGQAYLQSQQASIAIKGFRITVIVQFDQNIFLDTAFIRKIKHQGQEEDGDEHLDAWAECSLDNEAAPRSDGEPPHIFPEDIRPIPILSRPNTSRGHKCIEAELITDSSCKAELQGSTVNQQLKASHRGGCRGRKRGDSSFLISGK